MVLRPNSRAEATTPPCKDPLLTIISDKAPGPATPNLQQALEVSNLYELRNISPTIALKKLRYLLAKIYYEEKDCTKLELIEIYLIHDKLREITDICWALRYNRWMVNLSMLFPVFTNNNLNHTVKFNVLRRIYISMQMSFLPSPRAYFGRKDTVLSVRLIRKIWRKHKERKRPKKFVGVGYRDQGTCRNLAKDGSPSWQEVANSRVSEERKPSFPRDATFRRLFSFFRKLTSGDT